MLALARIYVNADQPFPTALLFWGAVGVGIVINALLVPILVLADIDRALSDGSRSFVAQAIAAARRCSDRARHRRAVAHRSCASGRNAVRGFELERVPRRAGWRAGYEASSISRHVRAGVLLGFLPGTVPLGPSSNASGRRVSRGSRVFLLAWVSRISHLSRSAVVEARHPHGADDVSGVALAVAIVVTSERGAGSVREWSGFTIWPTALCALPLVIFAGVYAFAGEIPGIIPAVLIAGIASLFIWSGQLGREGHLRRGPRSVLLLS